ncbi:MAG: phosphate/phosphite/phosphonate ABC transporter substrate-binding protein [Myxococcota bacterium]
MRQLLHRHAPLLLALVAMCISGACDRQESGSMTGGPEPAPPPLTEGDFRLDPDALPGGREKLRFGVAPTMGREVALREFSPIAEFLEHELGVPVEMLIATSYGDLIDQVDAEKVDLALLPPLSYVLARERSDDVHLLMSVINRGRTHYSAFILVRMDDPASSLEDLMGRRIAFVDRSSTSGYLMPRAALLPKDIVPERDFEETIFTGSHVRAIRMLARGEVDAAATATGMLHVARRLGEEAPESERLGHLRILYKTGRVPYDALCTVGDLPEEVLAKLEGAFLAMNTRNPEARAFLSATHGITGWAPAEDDFYDGVREVYRSVRSEDRGRKEGP